MPRDLWYNEPMPRRRFIEEGGSLIAFASRLSLKAPQQNCER